jgi:hypothetical protein
MLLIAVVENKVLSFKSDRLLESDNRKLRGLSEFLYLYKKVKNPRKPKL